MIVYYDHNNSTRQGHLDRELKNLGFSKGPSERHPDLSETKMWFRGRMQIDTVWISKDMDIEDCELVHFGFVMGHHRVTLV